MKNEQIVEEPVGDCFKTKCCQIEPDIYEVHLVNVATFAEFFGKVLNGMSQERVSIDDDNGSEKASLGSDEGIPHDSTEFSEEKSTNITVEGEDSHDSKSLDVEICKNSNVERPYKFCGSSSDFDLKQKKNIVLFVNVHGTDTDNACLEESTSEDKISNFTLNTELFPPTVTIFVDFIGKDSNMFDLEQSQVDAVLHGLKDGLNMNEYISDVGTELGTNGVDEDIDSTQEERFDSKLALLPRNAALAVNFCGTSMDIGYKEKNRNAEEPENLENCTSKPELLFTRAPLFSLHAHAQQGLRDWSWCRYISMCLVDRHFSIEASTSRFFFVIQRKPFFPILLLRQLILPWNPSFRRPLMLKSAVEPLTETAPDV